MESKPKWGADTADDDEEGEAADDVDAARPAGPAPGFRLGPPPPPPDCIRIISNSGPTKNPDHPEIHTYPLKEFKTKPKTQENSKKIPPIFRKTLSGPSDPNVQKLTAQKFSLTRFPQTFSL